MRVARPLLVLLLSGCGVAYPDAQLDLVPRVAVVVVSEPPSSVERTVLSTAEADRDAWLSLMRPGRVAARSASVGTPVEAGAPLLELERREAGASLRLAGARLGETEAVAEEARATNTRVLALGDGASESQRMAARTGVLRAEANVAAARATRDLAVVELDHLTLTAPFAGVLSWLEPEVGESVGAGTPVARVVATERNRVVVGLLEDEVTRLKIAPIRFEVSAGGIGVEATLQSVAAAADPRTLDWRAELVTEGAPFAPGTPVSVRLQLPQAAEGLLVPPSAVHDGQVWVLRDDRAQRVPVETVGESAGGLHVLGIEPGERVVVHGAAELEEGAAVVVVEAAP